MTVSTRSGRSALATALVTALVTLGGCANVGHDSGSNASTDGSTPSAEGQPASVAASDHGASSATADGSQPNAARYVLPGSQANSSALGSIVVTNPLAPRTLDLTQHPDDIWDRIRMGFAIPNIDTQQVAEQQAWYLAHPDYLRRAVERSSRYLYHIVAELDRRGMPTELALLPFVESAYNPMALSRAKASGMWQFIPGTGKDYNLKQDWWRDERRDVIASTDAALTYLQTIYEMHGDWHLALASYNWGEGSVKRAIEKNTAAGLPTDYLSLPMPDETRNYVPKLQALKNIVANPEAFGVTLPRIDNEPYFVAVTRGRDIDVTTAARLANMSLEDFRALNPSFNRPVIRASSTTPLLVPADRAENFRNGLESREPLATWQAHTVRKRETVEKIAAQYGMTSQALRQVNGLPAKGQVKPGQALLVQKKGEGDVALRFASFVPPTDIGMFGASPTPSTYQVKRGDTMASIARHLGIPVATLRTLNRLKSDQVAVGMQLQVPAATPKLVKVKSASPANGSAVGRDKTSAARTSKVATGNTPKGKRTVPVAHR
jgi:membrane-bound lytic murein transglycosylase D